MEPARFADAVGFDGAPIKWLKEEAERLQARRNMLYNAYQEIHNYGLCGTDDYHSRYASYIETVEWLSMTEAALDYWRHTIITREN